MNRRIRVISREKMFRVLVIVKLKIRWLNWLLVVDGLCSVLVR